MKSFVHWRCFVCAAHYAEHASACTTCLESGTIMRTGVRPAAAIDAQPEVTSAEALAQANFTLAISPAYPTLRIGAGSLIGVYGSPANGKSTLVTQFLNAFEGPVVLQSTEEAPGPSLQARLHRCHVRRRDFIILGKASVDQVAETVRAHRATALAIDSVQVAAFTAEELRHLLVVLAPTLRVLLGVCQVNKAGRIEGRERIVHEADVVVRVEAMRWSVEKSRFAAAGTSGPVFPEENDENP